MIACVKIDSPSASYLKSETRTCPVTCSISYYTGLGDEKTTTGNKKSVNWCVSEHLNDLDFLDCICHLSHPFVHMEKKLRDLQSKGRIAR